MPLPNKGTRNAQHQLTDSDIKEIRQLYESTIELPYGDVNRWTTRRLGKRFEVSRQTISKIVNYERYQWVK